jgi:hypothetical protein
MLRSPGRWRCQGRHISTKLHGTDLRQSQSTSLSHVLTEVACLTHGSSSVLDFWTPTTHNSRPSCKSMVLLWKYNSFNKIYINNNVVLSRRSSLPSEKVWCPPPRYSPIAVYPAAYSHSHTRVSGQRLICKHNRNSWYGSDAGKTRIFLWILNVFWFSITVLHWILVNTESTVCWSHPQHPEPVLKLVNH